MARDVDLNLLRALDAILDEQSVTKAAVRLGLSQPAMSASLGKLRRHFKDELLTRVGNTYEPSLAEDVDSLYEIGSKIMVIHDPFRKPQLVGGAEASRAFHLRE